MNVIALIAAAVGVTLMILTVKYGNQLKNRWLKYLAAAIGLVVSLVIMSYTPTVLGDNSIETATDTGSYLVVLIVIAVVVKWLFFRPKKVMQKSGE